MTNCCSNELQIQECIPVGCVLPARYRTGTPSLDSPPPPVVDRHTLRLRAVIMGHVTKLAFKRSCGRKNGGFIGEGKYKQRHRFDRFYQIPRYILAKLLRVIVLYNPQNKTTDIKLKSYAEFSPCK